MFVGRVTTINSWCRTQGARVSARVVIDFAPSLSLPAGNAWDVSRIPPGPAFGRQVIHINESLGLDMVYMNALALTYVSSRVSSKPRLAPPSLETY